MNTKEKQRAASAAVGARTARACDGCLRRRARWFCAADDAFLCQACDASVHSANPLASRHHRLRLKTATSSSSLAADAATPPPARTALDAGEPPTWLHGFKRKARTPRGKPMSAIKEETTVVPDLEAEEKAEEAEEQLLYQVPIFDPLLAEFCSPSPLLPTPLEDAKPAAQPIDPFESASAAAAASSDGLPGFREVSDLDVAEFAADMESLLGGGLEEDSFSLHELGLMDSEVKEEEADMDAAAAAGETEICREPMDVKFDCSAEEEAAKATAVVSSVSEGEVTVVAKKKMILTLDYEAVMAEWSCKGCSPWTGGERPQLGTDDCWPEFAGMWGGDGKGAAQHRDPAAAAAAAAVGRREARVTRYREKRRTRLFAKKIRYEVRKLNAEKRPRMKGRFVKRAAFPAIAAAVAAAVPAIPRAPPFPF
ncbi:Zinc finger protein CONSTANS-LIKE 16 [Ananas comosus]|uniref:Zinc finger protein CONSTANS-LIKE 16 n=1 Tax=Ananas comosus TaxID=4615 RepID=A0A199W0U4_ANACO|nr:Zinc finger protein CONSTANS-LIKE 16 [Ananas comosus]